MTSPIVINMPTRELLAGETKSSFVSRFQHLDNKRDLKITRFRVRVRVGLPVLGYVGNQSNLRYTGCHQVRSAQKCKGYVVFRMPSEHRLKLAEKYFIIRFNCLFFSYNILQICLRLKNGRSVVYFYQNVLVKKYLFKSNC